jgi:DNA-directed RNA polymerase III subunit RPC5
MTVKSTVDGEEDTTDTMAERITATQQEAWSHHSYIDEDSADAWERFHENLFVSNEVVENQELMEQTRNLSSGVEDSELLDTISVTTDAAKVSRRKINRSEKTKHKGKEKGKEKEADGEHTASAASSPSSGSDNEDGGPI